MPPKKNKKTKTKSKRYSCDLCTEIDNPLMIHCDQCNTEYHLKCLGIEDFNKEEEWTCFECLKRDLSRPPKSMNQSMTNQTNDSKSQSNVVKSNGDKTETEVHTNRQDSHRTKVNDGHSADNLSQAQGSQHSTKLSKATRSSVSRRAQLDLERLEEERLLKEKRDKEYLDKKYKILCDDRTDKSDRSVSQRHSTDRSSYTKSGYENKMMMSNVQAHIMNNQSSVLVHP